MNDQEFVSWLADRMVHVYGESPNVDFVHRARAVAVNIESQAREIERLKEGRESLILVRDDYKRQANEYRELWSRAAVKAQPSGVSDAQRLHDWNRSQLTVPIVVGREYQVAEARTRLSQQPASGGDERAAFVQWITTSYGDVFDKAIAAHYWEKDHIVALAWRAARAALPVREAVDGWLTVPIQPTEQMRKRAQDYLAAEGIIVSDWLIHTAYTELLAAAPSPSREGE